MTMEIIHLKQLHKIPGIAKYDDKKEICNKVVKAQLELANYLANNNNIPVVLESLYDDLNCENSSEMCAVTQQYVFPNRLPESFEQLTYVQKAMLYEYGAATTLTYMGILSKTYKSIDKNNSDKIDDEAIKLSYEELYLKIITADDFGNREHFALEKAKLAAQEYYDSSTISRKVFIVFGGAHDFNKECNEFGYKLSEIDFSQMRKDKNEISSTTLITESSENSALPKKLKVLSEAHPSTAKKLIQSQFLDIKELSNFAENHFEILKSMTSSGGLIDFIASGTLPLEWSLEVFMMKEHRQHLWGVVKDSLLENSISFEQFLAMPYDKMNAMHSFKTTEELASYVTNVVGDMDQATCLWIQ